MKTALIIVAVVFAAVLYTAWMNGVFLRCPHCRKIGSWRYDPAGPPVKEKDRDGVVLKRTEIRTCRKCGGRVLDRWSDHEGRSFEKESDPSTEQLRRRGR